MDQNTGMTAAEYLEMHYQKFPELRPKAEHYEKVDLNKFSYMPIFLINKPLGVLFLSHNHQDLIVSRTKGTFEVGPTEFLEVQPQREAVQAEVDYFKGEMEWPKWVQDILNSYESKFGPLKIRKKVR